MVYGEFECCKLNVVYCILYVEYWMVKKEEEKGKLDRKFECEIMNKVVTWTCWTECWKLNSICLKLKMKSLKFDILNVENLMIWMLIFEC